MKLRPCIWMIVLLSLAPSPAHAWGFQGHELIADRAIALLPDVVRPLFERRRSTFVDRSIDPDLWRLLFDVETPNHQVNIDDPAFGPYPFAGLPRDYSAALAKFGQQKLRSVGTLPWRVEELHGLLRRAFEDYGRRPDIVNQEHVLVYAASLVHYISDAHVPFHAVSNHDGQQTQQRGIHVRFESQTLERYADRLTLAPRPLPPIAEARAARDAAFDVLIEGARLSLDVLKADREAIGIRDTYDEAYYDAFFPAVRPILERRLNESIAASAALIAGAWEAAGKPAIPVRPSGPGNTRRQR